MAINKKLIHFKTKESFLSALDGTEPTAGSEAEGNAEYGQIKGSSIVFIKDTNEIWTHGQLYKSVNWSMLKLIIFYVSDVEYKAIKGMTFEEWVNSKYNIDGFYCNNSYVYTKEDVPLRSYGGQQNLIPSSTIILSSSNYTASVSGGGGSND